MKLFKREFNWWEIILYIILPCGLVIAGLVWLWKKGYIQKAYYWILSKCGFNKSTETALNTGIILPRGIRNKNPLNIKSTADQWKGKTGTDSGGFVIFDSMLNGCRASLIILKNYITLHKVNTLEAIVRRWEVGTGPDSPSTENYINNVAMNTGISRNEIIQSFDKDKLVSIAHAMSIFENGGNFVVKDTFNQAWNII